MVALAVFRAVGRLLDGVADRHVTDRVTRETSGYVLALRHVPYDHKRGEAVPGLGPFEPGADGPLDEPLPGVAGATVSGTIPLIAAWSAATMS